MKERIAILGSTGSIGTNALEVIKDLKDDLKVSALSADSSVDLLAAQARRFRPGIICVGSAQAAGRIRCMVPSSTKVVYGPRGLTEIVSRSDADRILFAVSGNHCLVPLARAIKHGKKVALANKEALVSGGSILMKLARDHKVEIVPVDSEHSAIFQCLEGKRGSLRKVYMTGSGGPLLNIPGSKFDSLSREFVLKHPKWRMGRKVSVDSATMMNKGLEVIEAHHLFGVPESSIDILIHPEAIVHSMVELVDGTVFAQLGVPDMRIPIQYALTYPSRSGSKAKRLDLLRSGPLTFMKPDTGRFPCLGLAREAARRGGTQPAALSVADEEAVAAYLKCSIEFSGIPCIIEKVMARHKNIKDPTLDDIIEAGEWAREEARRLCYH
ncbi:MAG: 1-deoxy-D-xylulose-5-phosphate reductoisomerase [Candidatus Omnitrophota bacterium]